MISSDKNFVERGIDFFRGLANDWDIACEEGKEIATVLDDCILNSKEIPEETKSKSKIHQIRSASILLRIGGVALGVLACCFFLKMIRGSLLSGFSGFTSLLLAHDCIKIGVNQSNAIRYTNPIKKDSLKDAAIGLASKILNTGWAGWHEFWGENPALEGTYLFKPLRDLYLSRQSNAR